MTTSINNGSITFADGTVQSTKTPTVTSAFINDSGYVTASTVSGTTPLKSQAGYNWSWAGYYMYVNTYNVFGGLIASQSFNCNCNC